MKALSALLLLVFLASCGSDTPAKAQVHSILAGQVITISGPWSKKVSFPLPVTRGYIWRIDSAVDKKTRAVHHWVFVEFRHFDDQVYFNYATDQDELPLTVKEPYHSGGHCGRDNCERVEKVNILLDENRLRKHAASGYTITLFAKSGFNIELFLSPENIKTQLDAVDRALAGNDGN